MTPSDLTAVTVSVNCVDALRVAGKSRQPEGRVTLSGSPNYAVNRHLRFLALVLTYRALRVSIFRSAFASNQSTIAPQEKWGMFMSRLAIAFALMLVPIAAAPGDSPQTPQIRISTRLVEIGVIVRD